MGVPPCYIFLWFQIKLLKCESCQKQTEACFCLKPACVPTEGRVEGGMGDDGHGAEWIWQFHTDVREIWPPHKLYTMDFFSEMASN